MLEASSHSPASSGVALDLRKTAPWIIFIIFFGVLNETVFNVSTPSIAAQYHLTPSGVSWVVTIFIIFSELVRSSMASFLTSTVLRSSS